MIPNESIQFGDEDVQEEEMRIRQCDPFDMKVRVKDFRKVYPSLVGKPVVAVEKTSFGLEYGECFAMLGVNGSGKSTTFKCLTNECAPTNGLMTINGMDCQSAF